ncbi:MAG TPA: hypothetical protein VFR36_05560 [Sphingomicrobium sp.]|nr:hypothetical protein [Sphingomicrobium sp.]
MTISFDKVSGLIRHVLTFGAGYLVAKGLIDETMTAEVVGAAMTLIGLVWSWMSKPAA